MTDHIHLVVATPCFGGSVSALYANSMIGLQKACIYGDINITLSFRFISGDSLIPRARNGAVQQFLSIPTATHLLFIDADISFLPEQVFALLAGNKDVCGAVYPAKKFDWERVHTQIMAGIPDVRSTALDYVVTFLDSQIDGGFVRARYIGTGFLMIKRSVFVKMDEHYPETRFRNTHLGQGSGGNAFFDCIIDPETGTYLSEDYTFCKRWLDIGGDIWAYLGSRLTHIGQHSFEGNLPDAIRGLDFLRKPSDG